MADVPVQRFVLLVLFQAQEDGATELKIAPNNSAGPAISYQVNGKWHNWAPNPAHILSEAINELLCLAGIEDSPFPKEGLINARCGGHRLDWKIKISSPGDACVLTPVLA